MNNLEIIGALFGIAGVWLTVKEKVWCFPVGIINVVITAYLVFTQKLYADTLQQVVYFILLILGWVNWSKIDKATSVKINFLTSQQRIISFIVFIGGSAIMYLLLKNYTDAALPFWDSTGTNICFIAQYLIAKKKIENWLLWMVGNVLYIGIFYVKGMEYYSVLSLIYLGQAVVGWRDWKRKLIDANNF
ncbi:MAG: nicotinamide riboside transporter PnuC [Bacteroidia bacterium]